MSEPCENLGYQILDRMVTPDEYLAIVDHLDWATNLNLEDITTALNHSLYGVVIENCGQVIGMGRIVGDNATLFVIQDVFVTQLFQDEGIEIAIIDALLIYLENHAPDRAVIVSLPSSNHIALFEQLGFRTTAPDAFGMFRVIDRTAPDRQRIPWA